MRETEKERENEGEEPRKKESCQVEKYGEGEMLRERKGEREEERVGKWKR